MAFYKSCFNLEGDADGLVFVTDAEIEKLVKAICEGPVCIEIKNRLVEKQSS